MAQRSGDAGIAAFAQSIEPTLVHHKEGQPPVPSAVQGTARAVPAGTGV